MFFAPVVRTNRAPVTAFRSPAFADFFNETTRNLNIEQDDKFWTVSLDMPGVAREQLEINVEGAVVSISTKAEAKRQYKAAYELPQDIDTEATEAELKDGVLTLKLAKKVPVSNARQIVIR